MQSCDEAGRDRFTAIHYAHYRKRGSKARNDDKMAEDDNKDNSNLDVEVAVGCERVWVFPNRIHVDVRRVSFQPRVDVFAWDVAGRLTK